MKNKKLFAILTLVAFMLTMMPVMAFATSYSDVYVWVEDASAKANTTDAVELYVDFNKAVGDDQAIYVYTTKAGQVYDNVTFYIGEEDAEKAASKGHFVYWNAGKTADNTRLTIRTNDETPANLVVKAVLVETVEGTDYDATGEELSINQINKGTNDDYDFFNIEVEDANITFKSIAAAGKTTFVPTVKAVDNGSARVADDIDEDETDHAYAYNEGLDANGGVDYYKVSLQLQNAAGDAVKNKEVNVALNKVGAELNATTLTTNNRGVVEFNVFATKEGTYVATVTADGANDAELSFKFGTAGIGSVAVKAQPTGNIALDAAEEVFVPVVVTDVNGNVLPNTDDTLNLLNNDRSIQFVGVPEDSDIEINEATTEAWFGYNTQNVICFIADADVVGNYTAKFYEPVTGADVEFVYFSVAKFDKAVSATIAYDATTYMLGATVNAPTVTVIDANGTKKTKNIDKSFSYTGVGVVNFDKDNGNFVLTADDKYLGQSLVVSVIADKCFATTTLNIADVPAYLQFDAATAAVGTEASVTVKSLDLKGNVAALGEGYAIEEVTAVVTSKPEGAVVSVDASNLEKAAFQKKGQTTVAIASNKEGTVTANIVVRAEKEEPTQGESPVVFLTGIATVDFGGKVTTVNSSATLIIGSNVFVANGGVLTSPVAPAIVDGRTYLPIRALSQALGAEVDYADNVVTIKYGNTVVTMTIGSNVMTVGAETVQIDAAPYIVDGTTMVPVRAAATALAYDIDVTYNVDGTVATVTVYKK